MIDLRKIQGKVQGFNYNVNIYSELLLIATSPITGEVAQVSNSEGTWWLPWSVGGVHFPSGIYIYAGTNWILNR